MKGTCFFVLMVFFLASCQEPGKSAFVNNFELFEQFKGKMELESRHKQDGLNKQQVLDSMKVQLVAMKEVSDIPKDRISLYEQRYVQLLKQFNAEVENRKHEYTQEVWKQINQYVYEYGQEHDYEYIFGSAGNGSLMYASDAKDITKEVIEYINNKYEGS